MPGRDIHVEVAVDLGGPEDHRIKQVHDSTPVVGVGVHRGRHDLVRRVSPVGLDGLQIEALHVEERAEHACLEHVDDHARDPARRETADDPLLGHDVLQIRRDRQRDPACTRLEGEAIFEETRGLDDARRRLGDPQPVWIACWPGSPDAISRGSPINSTATT